MTSLLFEDEEAVWEFYSPFAHIPGRYEWCRIHSPTHGSFDTFILLEKSTSLPPWVYVNSPQGLRFMADRYPETRTFQAEDLAIEGSPNGCIIEGRLRAAAGPVAFAEMRLTADYRDIPRAAPYGGGGFAVWGSRWSCAGIDLIREGRCDGTICFNPGEGFADEVLRAEPCVVTAGSFGRIRERREV
jgi:hypothetical protein